VNEWLVLRRQPWRENDWLLELFCKQAGRLNVIAPAKYSLDLMQEYQGIWAKSAENSSGLVQIKAIQNQHELMPTHHLISCAWYATELLQQLLPAAEPMPQLYDFYRATLSAFSDVNTAPEPWLRLFEAHLLSALGFGVSWQHDSDGHPIDTDRHYQFVLEQGWQPSAMSRDSCRGQHLLDIHHNQLQPISLRIMKQVQQQILQHISDKPIYSRALLIAG